MHPFPPAIPPRPPPPASSVGSHPYAPSHASTQSSYPPVPPRSSASSDPRLPSGVAPKCGAQWAHTNPPSTHTSGAGGAPPGFGSQASESGDPSQARWAVEGVKGPAGANLFVFHLPDEWNAQNLKEAFSVCGPVLSAYVILNESTGLSRGFGFVAYEQPVSAARALQVMEGHRVLGKRLKVSVKKGEEGALVHAMATLAAMGGPGAPPPHRPDIPRPHTPPGRPPQSVSDHPPYAAGRGIPPPGTPPRSGGGVAAPPQGCFDESDWQDTLPPDDEGIPQPPPYE